MSKIIGIDLGTTNSLVTVWEDGEVKAIPNCFGEYLTPSIVTIDKNHTVFVGKIAKEMQVTQPENTVAVFKRFMGTTKTYSLAGKKYKPEELSAMILRKLKEDAQEYLQEEVTEAIISVPAYFNDLARNATKNAGRLAGLKVDRIINEPSAAALAYQYQNKTEDATILVFDFGGGTLDVSLVDCFDNVVEILAVSGDNQLGGSDFDQVIFRAFLQENELNIHELPLDKQAIILEKAVLAKEELTQKEETVMCVNLEEKYYEMSLSRGKLVKLSGTLFSRMSIPVRKVLADTGTEIKNITAVVLVGGSCKMPIVKKYIQHILGSVNITVLNPDYMIAWGVGVYAGIKERNADIKDMLLTDICPFSLGIATRNPMDASRAIMTVILERNTALPASRMQPFTTICDYQKEIKVDIYQGEEYYAKDNLLLGTVKCQIPPALAGKEGITVRYTYDINGLLIVDITVVSTGEKKQLVIQNEAIRLTEQEMEEKISELNKLKVHPREKEENQALLEQSARLYAETMGDIRSELADRARYFQVLLERQDEYRIKRWRKQFIQFMEYIEKHVTKAKQPLYEALDFETWYMEEENNSEEKQEWQEEEENYSIWKTNMTS